MSLEIQQTTHGRVAILRLRGKLHLGEGTSRLRSAVRASLGAGYNTILLNLEHVPHVDSAGLGEILATYHAIKQRGGKLMLVHLSRQIRDLLRSTNLSTIFAAFDDEPAALENAALLAKPPREIH